MLWCAQNRQISTAVANIMAAMAKALPSYAWLTALPQLISRICHTNPEVNTVTNHIITHVAEAYPQQVHPQSCLAPSAVSLESLVSVWRCFPDSVQLKRVQHAQAVLPNVTT